MDSYTGSLKSSSGGGVGCCDEEYDSRAAANVSFSSFLNLPPPQHHQLVNNTPTFDQSFSGNRFHDQTPFLNLDMLNWPSSSKPSSEQAPLSILPSSPSSSPNLQTLFSSPALAATNSVIIRSPRSLPPSTSTGGCTSAAGALVPPALATTNSVIIRSPRSLPPSTSTSGGTSTSAPAAGVLVPPVRNSKKRGRASRRAPTTVLTTDTNNFRAMVQEFTGIPPPPFSSSSHFPIRMASSNYDIVRPFAHKMQTPSSLLIHQVQQQQQQRQQQDAFLSSITNTSNMGSSGGNSSSSNYDQMMNHNHHSGDSELGQMIKMYSSRDTNSNISITNAFGSGISAATRVPSNDGQFGLGSLVGRNVDHLSGWDEVVGIGSTQGGRPDVG